jgi:excinuclease ABC subunit C
MITPEDIGQLPTSPGVYLMKDTQGEVLYIGKAVNLQSRLRSHFSNAPSYKSFYPLVRSIDFMVTKNEVEALLLENALIKEKQPRYNVRLKDDKRYPYLKLSLDEKYPRLYLTRTLPKKGEGKKKRSGAGARHFGPYPHVKEARSILQSLQEVLPLRTCKIPSSELQLDRPCLEFEIHRCLAPCVSSICGEEEYRQVAKRVEEFLEGDHKSVEEDLARRMQEASEDLAFEKAAVYRDAIEALNLFKTRQTISFLEEDSEDYLAVTRVGDIVCVVCLRRRGGSIRGTEHYFLEVEGDPEDSEILAAFIEQHYSGAPEIPRRILCSVLPQSAEVLQTWLSSVLTKKVDVKKPHRGPRLRMLDLAQKNAEFHASEQYRKTHGAKRRIAEPVMRLGVDLGLDPLPLRIEGFDISHHGGEEPVASMVVFENGAPKKSDYRKFKIRGSYGGDDFRGMEEVLARRFTHLEEEFGSLPDLVLIDGGPVQLDFARRAIQKVALTLEDPLKSRLYSQQIVSLAKREEEIYLPEGDRPVVLEERNEGLKLLRAIRDESHRFAISFHRKRKGMQIATSALLNIPGIGPSKMEKLLIHFGSVEKIARADPGEVANLPGITRELAQEIVAACGKAANPPRDEPAFIETPSGEG